MRIGTCVLALAATAAACGGCIAYRPGSFKSTRAPFVGTHVTVGCIDLAVAQTDAPEAAGRVLRYAFGNNCAHAARIDLASIHVVGHYVDGVHPVHALDPKHELRPLRIAALDDEIEEIAYVGERGDSPNAMCLDVGRIDADLPPSQRWVCIGAWDLGAGDALGMGTSDPAPPDAVADTLTGWPLPPAADPLVADMPESVQSSPATVGRYLAEHIHDRKRLVKALHDYVVLRMHYDTAAAAHIDSGDSRLVPSQQAEDVFAARTAVCEGYSRLMVALGEGAGVEVAYVVGHARDVDNPLDQTPLSQRGHAWNAAKIDGRWVLIDATWDQTDQRDAPIRTRYLFTPPALFSTTHEPDDETWALLVPALSMHDFEKRLHGGSRGGAR